MIVPQVSAVTAGDVPTMKQPKSQHPAGMTAAVDEEPFGADGQPPVNRTPFTAQQVAPPPGWSDLMIRPAKTGEPGGPDLSPCHNVRPGAATMQPTWPKRYVVAWQALGP
ncbi:hypothetical protein ACIBCO_38280 [Streptomyces violascens]|uniref:hypothetical protein n=1 Tax=Streptomyces violascens TaxID=67381 RepID=UPI0037AD041F